MSELLLATLDTIDGARFCRSRADLQEPAPMDRKSEESSTTRVSRVHVAGRHRRPDLLARERARS